MNSNSYCFTVDNPRIAQFYKSNSNYKIEYDKNGDPNVCVIYFTSHALYYPNTEDEFIARVINKDFYEWYKTRHLNAGKHIFVRDVFKQWYLAGINSTTNSIDLLAQFLARETEGKTVTCIGASAGGYAAILLGCLIEARQVIAFNPRINLDMALSSSTEKDNAILHRMKDTEHSRFYDLSSWISDRTDIFYVYSVFSEFDRIQSGLLSKYDNIHIIPVLSALHGVPLPKPILSEFISSDKASLSKFVDALNRPMRIMLKINCRKAIRFFLRSIIKDLLTKICR